MLPTMLMSGGKKSFDDPSLLYSSTKRYTYADHVVPVGTGVKAGDILVLISNALSNNTALPSSAYYNLGTNVYQSGSYSTVSYFRLCDGTEEGVTLRGGVGSTGTYSYLAVFSMDGRPMKAGTNGSNALFKSTVGYGYVYWATSLNPTPKLIIGTFQTTYGASLVSELTPSDGVVGGNAGAIRWAWLTADNDAQIRFKMNDNGAQMWWIRPFIEDT